MTKHLPFHPQEGPCLFHCCCNSKRAASWSSSRDGEEHGQKKKTGWRENGGQVPRIMCHLRPKNMWPHVILTCPPPKAKKPPAGCIFPGACPCSLRRAKLSLVAHSKKLQHSLAGRVLRRCKAMIRTAQQLCQSPTPSTRDTHKQKKRQRLGIVIMAESMTKTRPKNSSAKNSNWALVVLCSAENRKEFGRSRRKARGATGELSCKL